MASTSEKPKKGILKHSGSVDHSKKEIEWDEMNILATYHPPDKDYGFMKVDEPPTPYNKSGVSDNEDESTIERKGSVSSVPDLDPSTLAERLEESEQSPAEKHFYDDDDSDESEENENETEEERKKRKAFLLKRKMHYNEFQAVQLAKKLMAEEEDDEDDDKDEGDEDACDEEQGSACGGILSPAQTSESTSDSCGQSGTSVDPSRKSGAPSVPSQSPKK